MTIEQLRKAAEDLLAKGKSKSAAAHLKEAVEHLDKMHKAHSSGMDNVKECLGKCMKALGAETEGEEGATAAGANAGVHSDPMKGFDPAKFTEELLAKMGTLIDSRIDANQEVLIKAIFGAEADPAAVTKAAGGVGDRALIVPPSRAPLATTPVNKTQDAGGGSGAAKEDEITDADVRKAASGDQQAILKVSRLIKTCTPEEVARIRQSMSSVSR